MKLHQVVKSLITWTQLFTSHNIYFLRFFGLIAKNCENVRTFPPQIIFLDKFFNGLARPFLFCSSLITTTVVTWKTKKHVLLKSLSVFTPWLLNRWATINKQAKFGTSSLTRSGSKPTTLNSCQSAVQPTLYSCLFAIVQAHSSIHRSTYEVPHLTPKQMSNEQPIQYNADGMQTMH